MLVSHMPCVHDCHSNQPTNQPTLTHTVVKDVHTCLFVYIYVYGVCVCLFAYIQHLFSNLFLDHLKTEPNTDSNGKCLSMY